MEKFIKGKWNVVIVLAILASFVVGLYVGNMHRPAIDKVLLNNKDTQVATDGDFAPFWKVWNTINEKYPGANKVSDQEKIYGAISGLMESLNDPYSMFFDPDETKSFEETIAGNFSGIGLEVGLKDKVLTVIAPLKDTPAYRANIKPGDKILKIDGKVTSGMSTEDAIKLIRGEKGTAVTLSIFHEGDKEPIDVKIVRDVINIPTLDSELRPDGIFLIKLYSFSENSADLFRGAMKKFVDSGSDKLLLDLRSNPGGYLDRAIDVSSWFLPEGKTVVIEDYGDKKPQEIIRSRGYNIFTDKLKFVILIDGGSASAAEIVAGAMQDNGRAKLVGLQSFGKGSVQEPIQVTSDTLLKITVAKWLTPNGTWISEKGLTPDYVVEFTKKDAEAKKDPQMDKAVQLLLK